MPNIIEFANISKSFGKKEVLRGVSFKLKEGEILGLVGLSGCGKTTLFNILIGLVREDSGEILFLNEKRKKNWKILRQTSGYASQSLMVIEELSIKENCFYFGSLYGMKRNETNKRMSGLLELFNLRGTENVLIKKLSGGMKERANLLVSMIHNPRILILDEPTVGLDPIIRGTLWSYIRAINNVGTTIIVASHFMEELEKNCDRIVFLKNGKIVAEGNIQQFKNFYGREQGLNEIFNMVMKDEAL